MRIVVLALMLALFSGCGHKPSTGTRSEAIFTVSPEERGLVEGFRKLGKTPRQEVIEYVNNQQMRSVQQGAWSRNLLIIGVGLSVVAVGIGLLKLLGAL